METKFNSFVETFYLVLEDQDYVKAREQVTIMKTWCDAYLNSLQNIEDKQEYKAMHDELALFQQMMNHCNKRLCDTIFKTYSSNISSLTLFPSNFWDICKENELESTVVDYFNKDGFQQVRQLIETTIRREMAVSFSSSQTGIARIDLSNFIQEDLTKFCTITDYVFQIITFCQDSPFSNQLEPFLSNSLDLVFTSFHHFDICLHSLHIVNTVQTLQSNWKECLSTIQNECETGCITQSFNITEDQLTSISTYLSLFTTFLHHLQLFFPLLPSKQSLFTSCLDEFPQLESFYTEICIYQIIHESIQNQVILNPATVEDLMIIVKESIQRQHLAGQSIQRQHLASQSIQQQQSSSQSIQLKDLFTHFILPFFSSSLSHLHTNEQDSRWLGCQTNYLLYYDGICLMNEYLDELKKTLLLTDLEDQHSQIQTLLSSVEQTIHSSLQPSINTLVLKDWEDFSFSITPDEYDSLLLEPIQFPSLDGLNGSSLLSESGKNHFAYLLCQLYCEGVYHVLIRKKFTECGGLLLKRYIRVLNDLLIDLLGDDIIGCIELKKLQLFSYIVSTPKDVLDISLLCTNSAIELSPEEQNTLLSLRI